MFLWVLFSSMAITTAWTASEIVWLFVLCGVLTLLVKAPLRLLPEPKQLASFTGIGWLLTGVHGPVSGRTLWTLSAYFAKAGAFVFGSGLAIVPFLYGGVVGQFHWLNGRQFLDAVAVAMITPGPVVDHGGLHRLFSRRAVRGDCGIACRLCAPVPNRRHRRTVLPPLCPEPPGKSFRPGCYVGCGRRNCRSGFCSRQACACRCTNGAYCPIDFGCVADHTESTRALSDSGGWNHWSSSA